METITQEEWIRSHGRAFRNVFASFDPFSEPLRPDLEDRALVFPIAYRLTEDQFAAVVRAARISGDPGICVSAVEGGEDADYPFPRHWYLQLWETSEYQRLTGIGVLENAIYSPLGKWGIMVSQSDHAVVGGAKTAVEEILSAFPSREDSLREFLDYWDYNERVHGVSLSWLPSLLTNVGAGEPT